VWLSVPGRLRPLAPNWTTRPPANSPELSRTAEAAATTSFGLAGRHSSGTYGAQRPGASGDELIQLWPQPRDFTPWNITDETRLDAQGFGAVRA
jgi:hypothetical protein